MKQVKVNKNTKDAENISIDADTEFTQVTKSAHYIKVDLENNKLSNKNFFKTMHAIENEMDKLFHQVFIAKDVKCDNFLMLGHAYFYAASAYLAVVEKNDKFKELLTIMEDHLTKCLVLLYRDRLNPKCILTVLCAYSELGLLSFQADITKSKLFLRKAVQLYLKYTEENQYPVPIDFRRTLGFKPRDTANIRDVYKQALGSVVLEYDAYTSLELLSDKEFNKYLFYKHNLLKLQFAVKEPEKRSCIWSEQFYDLGIILAHHGRFVESRNHLAFVTFKLQIPHNQMYINVPDPSQMKEELCYWLILVAKNSRCWARYGIILLLVSKERLLYGQSCVSSKTNSALPESSKSEKKPTKLLLFSGFEKELEAYNNQITDDYLSDYISAKIVFASVLRWLHYAKNIHLMLPSITAPTDHVSIALNISAAYKYLAYYEPNEEKRIRFHKRRIHTLEENMKSLKDDINPKVVLELALAHSTILAERIENLQTMQLNEKQLEEIDFSVQNIVTNFQLFLNEICKFQDCEVLNQ